MMNFLKKLFLLFAFILCCVGNSCLAQDLGINSVIYDNSQSLLSINSFDNDAFTFASNPKLTVISGENKAYFDINSAVLKCSAQDLIISSSDVKEILVKQYSTNPNVVRVFISYKEGFNPASIQLKKINNSLFLKFSNPVMQNYYFQSAYTETKQPEFFEQTVIQTPVLSAQNSVINQINSSFNSNSVTQNYTLMKKDLLLTSKYYIDNINPKTNSVVITGIGSFTLSQPFYLTNPTRVAYDIPNSIVNPAIRNKEIKFGTEDSIKIGQFDKNTARIVLNSPIADRFLPVIFADSQRLVFADKLSQEYKALSLSDTDLTSVIPEVEDGNSSSVKMFFSHPIIYSVERLNSHMELTILNVDKFVEDSIRSSLKYTRFSKVKITELQNGGVKFSFPIDEKGNISIYAGIDGKTIRIKQKFVKTEIPKPKLEPAVIVVPTVIPTKSSGKKVVVIDPGHGGSDCGATRNGIYEKNITLDVSKRVEELLRKKGYSVEMTRTTDQTVSLQDRVAFSEAINPDIFVSIHVNSSNSDSPSGIETHYYKDNSLKLAKYIHASMLNNINSNNRGLFKSKFYVINHTTAPAILVEIGFISNPTERAQLVSENRKQATAKAIAEGIYEYFK